jgi:hypothetical protein
MIGFNYREHMRAGVMGNRASATRFIASEISAWEQARES